MKSSSKKEQHLTLTLLREGDIEVTGQFTWGSNFTFLAKVRRDGTECEAVYKPQRGERPLHVGVGDDCWRRRADIGGQPQARDGWEEKQDAEVLLHQSAAE